MSDTSAGVSFQRFLYTVVADVLHARIFRPTAPQLVSTERVLRLEQGVVLDHLALIAYADRSSDLSCEHAL